MRELESSTPFRAVTSASLTLQLTMEDGQTFEIEMGRLREPEGKLEIFRERKETDWLLNAGLAVPKSDRLFIELRLDAELLPSDDPGTAYTVKLGRETDGTSDGG